MGCLFRSPRRLFDRKGGVEHRLLHGSVCGYDARDVSRPAWQQRPLENPRPVCAFISLMLDEDTIP